MIYFFWDLMAQSLNALPALFVLALCWLSIQLSDLISARAGDERVRASLERLSDAVSIAVREAEQALLESLRRASPGGSPTVADRGLASASATRAARAYLGSNGWRDLGTTLGLSNDELERLLAARVETAIYELRAQPARALGNALRLALSSAASGGAVATGVSAASYSRSKMGGNARVQ